MDKKTNCVGPSHLIVTQLRKRVTAIWEGPMHAEDAIMQLDNNTWVQHCRLMSPKAGEVQ